MIFGNTGDANKSCVLALTIKQIQNGERKILRIQTKNFRGNGAGVLGCPAHRCADSKFAQRGKAPLADHFTGDFMNGRQNAADSVRGALIRNWAVRDSEVCLFGELRAVRLEFKIFDPGRWTSVERRINEWLQHMPDFCPALFGGLT